MSSEIISTTPESEIVSSRVVKAPIELVYLAWTDPAHLKNWWGPAGFTNTFHEFDLRPGGNECEFIVIDEPTMIAWQRISKPIFQVVATFERVSDHTTKVVLRCFSAPKKNAAS